MFNHDIFLLPSDNIGSAITYGRGGWGGNYFVFSAFTPKTEREINVKLNRDYTSEFKILPLMWSLRGTDAGHDLTCYCSGCLYYAASRFDLKIWKINNSGQLRTTPYWLNTDPSSGEICFGNNDKPINLRECFNLFWNSKFSGDYSSSYYFHRKNLCQKKIHDCHNIKNGLKCPQNHRHYYCREENLHLQRKETCLCCHQLCQCNHVQNLDSNNICTCCTSLNPSIEYMCKCFCDCETLTGFQSEIEVDRLEKAQFGSTTFKEVCPEKADGIFITKNLTDLPPEIKEDNDGYVYGFAKKQTEYWEIRTKNITLEIPESQLTILASNDNTKHRTQNNNSGRIS